jgi:hypothetical protein
MFTHHLMHPDGTPAEKPTFRSSEPDWHVGGKVLIRTGVELQIVGMQEPSDDVHGVWIVEPVRSGA